jgi:uncharacterized C2H2 Zn-finger protein
MKPELQEDPFTAVKAEPLMDFLECNEDHLKVNNEIAPPEVIILNANSENTKITKKIEKVRTKQFVKKSKDGNRVYNCTQCERVFDSNNKLLHHFYAAHVRLCKVFDVK